jgi:hypothetical protein
MSVAPPTGELVLALEGSRRLGRRGGGTLRLSAGGAEIAYRGALRAPLVVPLGALRLGLVDAGSPRAAGRFPVSSRGGHAVEGWLWTSSGGSALTVLGDGDEPPNAALLFTTPLGEDAVACFEPAVAADIVARSPLGAPTLHGLLFRVRDPLQAETAFRRFGLLGPLTERDVPPTLRRSLPTDRRVRSVGSRPTASVAPPGANVPRP